MQKTIYVKDVETWDSVKAEAEKNGRSVSGYLLHLHEWCKGPGIESVMVDVAPEPVAPTDDWRSSRKSVPKVKK